MTDRDRRQWRRSLLLPREIPYYLRQLFIPVTH